MCGPIAYAQRQRGRGHQMRYLAGRMLGYVAAGAVAGATGRYLTALIGPTTGMVLSWLLAAALVVAAIRMWRRPSARQLVTIGRKPPLLVRIRRWTGAGSLALGAATACLPCGMLWAALAVAAASGSAGQGAALMFGFAFASGVALWGAASIAQALAARIPSSRRILAVCMLAGAVVIAARPIAWVSAGSERPPCHEPSSSR